MPVQTPTSEYLSPAEKLPDGRFKYDPNFYDMLGPKAQEGMETRLEWRHREAYEAAYDSITLDSTPGLRDRVRRQAEYNAEEQQIMDRLNAGFEPRGGLVGFAEDLASGWWEFAGRKLPASMLYAVSSDDQFQEALDDIKSGNLDPGGFLGIGDRTGVSYTKEELASRWNDPDGTAREIGNVLGSTSMSAVALLGGAPAGVAIIATFGVMGLGDGMAEFDRIAAENNLDPHTTERLLMGVGYGVAEAGAEYLGLGAAKLSAALIGRKMAKDLGKSAVEKGMWAGVKKYGKFVGVTIPAGAAVEGGEEVATQLAQNSIRAWADPNVDWTVGETFEGTVDAFVMGAFGGGIMVGPAIAVESYKQSQRVKERLEGQADISLAAREKEIESNRLKEVVGELDETPVEPEMRSSELGEPEVSVWDGRRWNWVNATEENVALAKAQLEAMRIDETETPPADITPERMEEVKEGIRRGPQELVEDEEADIEGAVGVFDSDGNLRESLTYGPDGRFETQEEAQDEAGALADRHNEPRILEGQEEGFFETSEISVEEAQEFVAEDKLAEEGAVKGEEVVEDQPTPATVAAAQEEAKEATTRQESQQAAVDEIDRKIRRSAGLPDRKPTDAPLARVLGRKEERDKGAQPAVLKRLRVFAKRQGRATGKPLKIVQVEAREGAGFDGMYHDGVIYVDAAQVRDPKKESEYSKQIFTRILAHELTHAGRVANPELYEALLQSMPKSDLAVSQRLYAGRLGKGFEQLSEDARIEEALATHIEETIFKIGSGRFTGDQTLVNKVVDFVRSTAAKYGLKGKFSKNLDSIVRQMADGKSLEEITLPGMQEADTVAAPTVEGDPKFSPTGSVGDTRRQLADARTVTPTGGKKGTTTTNQ